MSIFFDFDVGVSGRRFRRAVDGDKSDINLFLDEECNKLFGEPDIGSLIELSALSICMINEEKAVVGFMALSDRPKVPAVDPADWETWIRNMFQRYYLSRNTLFIHYMCCMDSVVEYFMDEALVTVFNNDLYLHQIIMTPPCTRGDILTKHQVMKKRNVCRFYAKRDDDPNSSHALYAFVRQEFCPKLRMRRAVEEDNDDIVDILDKMCPRMRDLYGSYYISELIGRHPESTRKIIVAEHSDRVVGVMCLNTDINYKKLAATYDLHQFYGLTKVTPLEKEKAKRENVLSRTFGEPIMLGNWIPYRNMNKVETSKLENKEQAKQDLFVNKSRPNSKVYFGRRSTTFKGYRKRYPHSDDLSEKVFLESPLQSHSNSYSIAIGSLMEEEPFDYEIVNIDKTLLNVPNVEAFCNFSRVETPRESKIRSIRKRRLSLHYKKQNKSKDNVDFAYKGPPNAFMIELLGFQDDVHERYVFELLEAAFELMKEFDYCIIKVPCAEKAFPLLQHFCFVPTKPSVCSKHALYIAHRASILGKLRVRQAEICDVPQLATLLQDLDVKHTLWTIENNFHHKDNHKVYVFLSGFSVVGVGILESTDQINILCSRFNSDLYHNQKYHFRGNAISAGFVTLKVAQTYSVFEVHSRYFIREMMRLSGSSAVLWLTAYRNKIVANKANSLAIAMIPLMPRKFEIDCVNVPELKILSRLSKKMYDLSKTTFASWFMGRRLTSLPKVDVNTRILVIGASQTSMAFINALIFSDASTYLNFTSVTLISPNGLPYLRRNKPLVELMFPTIRTSTDLYMKRVPYTYYINTIHGTMVGIDRHNKFVTLSNGSVVHYDLLFLLLGKQYQHPNYLCDVYEKEDQLRSAITVPYTKLDIPQRVNLDVNTTENLPENVFLVNNETNADAALKFIETIVAQECNSKILVYGASIHAYCCLSALLEMKVPPENIVFVEPFPPEDEQKIRVPMFYNANVDKTVRKMLSTLNITVYRSYYFQSWVIDEYNFVTHINFLSYFEMAQLECSAFFYYGKRGVSVEALEAINKSGIVYDGGILIDHEFRTKDPFVYAAGPATRYCRRYYAEIFRQKYYDSYEIGTKLGGQIRNQLDPLFTSKQEKSRRQSTVRFSVLTDVLGSVSFTSNQSDRKFSKSMPEDEDDKYEKLPIFKKPITIHCKLPGGLRYLEVRPPGLKTPNYYVQTLDYNGFVMETFKDGYFKLHLNKDYIVDGITCLSPDHKSLENFKNLYGLSSAVLNNVYLRYTTIRLDSFYDFFRAPWSFFLYHEQCEELLAMTKQLRPKGQRKGGTLGENLMAVGDKLSNASFHFDTKIKIRSMFEHSPHVEAITDYVMEWLTENETLLPMYLQPSHLVYYHHDLARHPAFKKKKTKLLKLFQNIF